MLIYAPLKQRNEESNQPNGTREDQMVLEVTLITHSGDSASYEVIRSNTTDLTFLTNSLQLMLNSEDFKQLIITDPTEKELVTGVDESNDADIGAG